jgi:hypothetical protein
LSWNERWYPWETSPSLRRKGMEKKGGHARVGLGEEERGEAEYRIYNIYIYIYIYMYIFFLKITY